MMRKIPIRTAAVFQISSVILVSVLLLVACSTLKSDVESQPADACPVTEPEWIRPPDDPAVSGSPEPEYFFINSDQSIWASAWWVYDEDYRRANEEGIKVGWFRPEGAELLISGERLDGEMLQLHSDVPCCYPTRFQATGLYFPAEGCWEVTAIAGDSMLSFIVKIDP